MRPDHSLSSLAVFAVIATIGAVLCADSRANEIIQARAAGFVAGNASIHAGTNVITVQLDQTAGALPFNQSAIKQSTEPARLGPDPKFPYFTVRFALPIPPENMTDKVAALTGIDPAVFTHNHSPGFEILPNGDALAIWFSTPPGESESAKTTTFIQARLRYGAEEWDMPELFLDFEGLNDQSGLLWNDQGRIWFFGGGRDAGPWVPFKIATSMDNGATWTLSLPQLDQAAQNFEAQPITSAFRSLDGAIYFAMDGAKAHSFLWRSVDEGIHWHQQPGRTGARHSAIVPLDGTGDLLSIGGKNASMDGYSPENLSTNWGESWSASTASPFPPLGSAQRPSLIRLASHNLFFVSDAYLLKEDKAPPAGWNHGNGCFVAISTNNGASWRVKPLPVQLRNHERGKFGTLGYVTARQAPNGIIHVLTTETQPCLHYEMNETWIFSDAGDLPPENSGGKIQSFSENYSDGTVRSRWSARICPNGRYLLDGEETDFYPGGLKEHQATYANGLKMGAETFWSPDGAILWRWSHDLENHTSVWTQYWPNGRRKFQSTWDTKPEARDLKRQFFGLVANGLAGHWSETGEVINQSRFSDGKFTEGNVLTAKGGQTP